MPRLCAQVFYPRMLLLARLHIDAVCIQHCTSGKITDNQTGNWADRNRFIFRLTLGDASFYCVACIHCQAICSTPVAVKMSAARYAPIPKFWLGTRTFTRGDTFQRGRSDGSSRVSVSFLLYFDCSAHTTAPGLFAGMANLSSP